MSMDGARITRLRWRMHGAWMWPSFIVLTVLDGALVSWRPLSGDSESAVSGWLLGLWISLVGIVVLAPALGMALRRVRRDMPKVVARDYAGTAVIVAVTAAFLAVGLIHHSSVTSDDRAIEDAVARAESYIGDHAPSQFQVNLGSAQTLAIQPGSIYRTCVRNRAGTESYCVVVNRDRPIGRSVSPAGSEPNQFLAQGTG
jgi:hypothetical protein